MSDPSERKVKSLAELARAVEPRRDLWPGIAARLERGAPAAPPLRALRRGAPLRGLAAAAMVASVALGVWIGRDLLPLPGAAPAPVPLTSTPATSGGAAAINAAYLADPRFRREREALLASVQARLAAMPPAARAKVSASLAAIDKAKRDLESALGKDPSNALLQELLINTYQDEMRVLTDVHEAGTPGTGI